jgi:preprotein translocase subunit SecE
LAYEKGNIVAMKKASTAEKPGEQQRQKTGARRRPAVKKQEAAPKSGKSRNKLIRYFQDTRDELRKVTWPSRQEAIRLTLIVLATTLTFSIALGFLDFIFQRLAGLLI